MKMHIVAIIALFAAPAFAEVKLDIRERRPTERGVARSTSTAESRTFRVRGMDSRIPDANCTRDIEVVVTPGLTASEENDLVEFEAVKRDVDSALESCIEQELQAAREKARKMRGRGKPL